MLIALNKPYGVHCRFGGDATPNLSTFVPFPRVYPAGRLDADSEGLVLLTDDGSLQARIAHPRHKLPKLYWVQVEGEPTNEALTQLTRGVPLGDFLTQPCKVDRLSPPARLWPRDPPVRLRKTIPTEWIALELTEGKNRQVRRMTAAVGYPTLRLIRAAMGPLHLADLGLEPGQWRIVDPRALESRGKSVSTVTKSVR